MAEERISFEFYDENGILIEDTFFISGSDSIEDRRSAELAIRTVEFDPPIAIPLLYSGHGDV